MSAKSRAMAFRDEVEPTGAATVFAVGEKQYTVTVWTDEPRARKYFTRLADAVVFHKPNSWHTDSTMGIVFLFEEELV